MNETNEKKLKVILVVILIVCLIGMTIAFRESIYNTISPPQPVHLHVVGNVQNFTSDVSILSNASGTWSLEEFDIVVVNNSSYYFQTGLLTTITFAQILVPQLVGHTVNITYVPSMDYGFNGYLAVNINIIS